jgi:hypothetical protein
MIYRLVSHTNHRDVPEPQGAPSFARLSFTSCDTPRTAGRKNLSPQNTLNPSRVIDRSNRWRGSAPISTCGG